MGKSRAKPSSPADAHRKMQERRRQAFEAVNLSPEVAELLSGANIEVTRAGDKREGQTVKEDSARRLDAFSALKDGMARDPKYVGCYDAARRLEADILTRRGEADKGRFMERVDGDAKYDLTDRIIAAAEAVEAVAARLSKRDWWLLHELIAPSKEYEGGWRGAVAYVTGETNWNVQGGLIRNVCANLRDAYEELDVVARKAA